MSEAPGLGSGVADEDAARRLFRYLSGEEWQHYRAILGIFAGTFFSELTPAEVRSRLLETGVDLEEALVTDRLERLRDWGNLAVSSSVGNPTSVSDYYRLRSRYLITRVGQEVHDVVEQVLGRVASVADVAPGRLRAIAHALGMLAEAPLAALSPSEVGDLVRAVFDPHRAFTTEVTQFFAEVNQWQSRYDLSADEFHFFAQVLVGYVAEALDEIRRTARPLVERLARLEPVLPAVVDAMRGTDLASRVSDAGLAGTFDVARTAGARLEDWDTVVGWYAGTDGLPSRLDRLDRDAMAAVRTLTRNLTRLSRSGLGGASRRGDHLRLAAMLDAARSTDEVSDLVTSAFGLFGPLHYGVLSGDADDPVATTTAWADAPPAAVPIALRERGNTANRGAASRMTDRVGAQDQLRRRRQTEAEARSAVDDELAAADLGSAVLSAAGLARLQHLVGRAMPLLGIAGREQTIEDGRLHLTLRRSKGVDTVVVSAGGALRLCGLEVEIAVPRSAESGGG